MLNSLSGDDQAQQMSSSDENPLPTEIRARPNIHDAGEVYGGGSQ